MLHEQGDRVPDSLASRRLEAIFTVAGPVQHTVVAAQTWALRRHLALLAGRCPRVLIAPREPDSADHLLLDCGHLLAAQGYGEFFIASRDGIFAPFAKGHRTTVITPNRRTLSRELREAAVAIIELRCGSPST
ncbi:NYN domain-containing protein [Actinomadura rubrisoli]|uniref:NYN domain-containing protein n=1 Tax=Actinomadura rubrisoli TaxID=2530368 RepID=A0A4R5C5V5_9ACTN|nr:NYN domain-containing protein [Actinomadura rubrisoli]TDD95131.1 NYN domain-containing protein [Actinomadura rubrisoli]